MTVSCVKNQKAVKQIIENFIKENKNFPVTSVALEEKLTEFVKYFAKHIMDRVAENDCYFVDMLEDFERMEND